MISNFEQPREEPTAMSMAYVKFLVRYGMKLAARQTRMPGESRGPQVRITAI